MDLNFTDDQLPYPIRYLLYLPYRVVTEYDYVNLNKIARAACVAVQLTYTQYVSDASSFHRSITAFSETRETKALGLASPRIAYSSMCV